MSRRKRVRERPETDQPREGSRPLVRGRTRRPPRTSPIFRRPPARLGPGSPADGLRKVTQPEPSYRWQVKLSRCFTRSREPRHAPTTSDAHVEAESPPGCQAASESLPGGFPAGTGPDPLFTLRGYPREGQLVRPPDGGSSGSEERCSTAASIARRAAVGGAPTNASTSTRSPPGIPPASSQVAPSGAPGRSLVGICATSRSRAHQVRGCPRASGARSGEASCGVLRSGTQRSPSRALR